MIENKKLVIYSNKKNLYEKELKKLEQDDISNQNKALITKFHNYLFAKGSKDERISKVSYQLRKICRLLINCLNITNDLDKLTKDEVQRLIALINRLEEFREATKGDYRRVIKQFYFWFREEDTKLYSNNEKERIETQKFYRYL